MRKTIFAPICFACIITALGFSSICWADKQLVIYDTDMAIDDWSALIFLAKHPDIELKAVTLSASGETHCTPGIKNVLSLLDLSGAPKNIDVACGDEYPLDGYFVFPTAWQKDADTLSGVPVPESKRRTSTRHAVETIHQIVSNSSRPVTLVPVGPLTNIAQWLEKYPSDKKNINRVVIMGGALHAKGNIIVPGFTDSHPNTRAEWNIFIDPLAANKVFKSGLPIEMVGLDVTNEVRVTMDYVKSFRKKVNNPAADFFNRVFIKNEKFIKSNEYYFWDVLAALITVEPSLCKSSSMPVSVSYLPVNRPVYLNTSDNTMPAIRWDGKPRQHLNASKSGITRISSNGPAISVCLQTNREKAFGLFTETITDNIEKRDK